MKVDYENKDKLLKFEINEEIDHHISENLRRTIDYEIQRRNPKRIILDFNNVYFMDSAGIGMVIGRYKTASMIGAKLEMKNVRANIKRIFEMTGVLKIIPIIEEEEQNEKKI
jgi:stage II sporulation protein AA (anti-sigma F factor antagonist)